MNKENKKYNGDITITIPSTLLQSIYHVASRLDNVQDMLSWLIHLLEGQGVDAYPQDDNDALPEQPDDCVDASSVCDNDDCMGLLNDCHDCMGLLSDCEDYTDNSTISICKTCLGLGKY